MGSHGILFHKIAGINHLEDCIQLFAFRFVDVSDAERPLNSVEKCNELCQNKTMTTVQA